MPCSTKFWFKTRMVHWCLALASLKVPVSAAIAAFPCAFGPAAAAPVYLDLLWPPMYLDLLLPLFPMYLVLVLQPFPMYLDLVLQPFPLYLDLMLLPPRCS